jgi:hypothetical protein
MTRRPNVSQTLALKAAAAAAQAGPDLRETQEAEGDPNSPAFASNGAGATRRQGRPRGKRPVAARQTVYLDDARHAALVRIAEDRGRSIHSLIIEGIDHVIGKPVRAGWE